MMAVAPHTSHQTGACESVALVQGGGSAIKQWMHLVQRTDTGTLETMAACRSYSERLPQPLPFPSPRPPCAHLSELQPPVSR